MTELKFFTMMSDIDDDLILSASVRPTMIQRPRFRTAILAAAIALLLIVSVIATPLTIAVSYMNEHPEIKGGLIYAMDAILEDEDHFVNQILPEGIRDTLGSVFDALTGGNGDPENTPSTSEPITDQTTEESTEEPTEETTEEPTEETTEEPTEETTEEPAEETTDHVHDPVVDDPIPATCQSTGLTEGAHCKTCHEEIIPQQIIPKEHHRFEDRNVCVMCGNEFASEGMEYELVQGGYTLVGLGSCDAEEIVIPASYNGQPVIAIGAFAFGLTGDADHPILMKKIYIPNTIERIEKSAFEGCRLLEQIVFSENSSLESIGERAFAGCPLVCLDLPEGLKTIESAAFISCYQLTEVTVPTTLQEVGDSAFKSTKALSVVRIKDIEKWCGISFFDQTANPASSAEKIFTADGELIEHLVLPEGMTEISAYAFFKVKSIQSVTFPTTLQYIGNQAFGSNGNMGDVYISDLSAWCRVNRDGDESVMSSTLYLNGVEVVDLVIPDDVDRIGTYAFSRFSSIKTVTMPNTVTEIGEGAFMHTWYLERISLSDAVTVLPEKLFYENRNLQEIKMPEQLESIGESAFYLCESVKEITIPAKVSKIEVDAFTQCWGLSKAYFENREGWVTVSTGSDEPYTWHPDWFTYPADAASALKDYSYCVWYRS